MSGRVETGFAIVLPLPLIFALLPHFSPPILSPTFPHQSLYSFPSVLATHNLCELSSPHFAQYFYLHYHQLNPYSRPFFLSVLFSHRFSVPHDWLLLDTLERDLRREKMGLEPTTVVTSELALSFTYDSKHSLYKQPAKTGGNREGWGELEMAVWRTDEAANYGDSDRQSDAGQPSWASQPPWRSRRTPWLYPGIDII